MCINVHKISQIPCSNRRLIVNYVYHLSQWTYPWSVYKSKKYNAEVSCTWTSTSKFPIQFQNGVLGKETLIVRATADNQNQLRFTAEHQTALHTDGAWVG
jgi:hypothetical protein